MSVVTIFSSEFCRKESVVRELVDLTGYRHVTDEDVLTLAAELSGTDKEKLRVAFKRKMSVFNKFTHEKEYSVAWLRLAIAEIIADDDLLIDGFTGLLIPKTITHVLGTCIVADISFRLAQAEEGLPKKEALQRIRKADENCAAWMDMLFKIRDPWDPSLYDIVIPADKTGPEESVRLIEENLRSEVIHPTDSSRRAARDFMLASNVGVALAGEGHNAEVSVRDGAATLTINKNVLMLNRLEEELKSIAVRVEGVNSVETRIGKGFHRTDIYRKYDFDIPKLLLVDDEREFVHTLSERLLMRDMNSAIAYDGEAALNILHEDEPEVMLLDLKMPGIDGIEVLRKVKQTRPEVEVIILTGHGSEEDRKTCISIGAFAYLQKPVDINVLTETLKKANEKLQRNKARKSDSSGK